MRWMLGCLKSQYNVVRWLIDQWRSLGLNDLSERVDFLRNENELMRDKLKHQNEISETQNKKITTLDRRVGQLMRKTYGKPSK